MGEIEKDKYIDMFIEMVEIYKKTGNYEDKVIYGKVFWSVFELVINDIEKNEDEEERKQKVPIDI